MLFFAIYVYFLLFLCASIVFFGSAIVICAYLANTL